MTSAPSNSELTKEQRKALRRLGRGQSLTTSGFMFCVKRGFLKSDASGDFGITDAGRAAFAALADERSPVKKGVEDGR